MIENAYNEPSIFESVTFLNEFKAFDNYKKINGYIEKIKQIKNETPSSDDEEKIKKFVDKNYDDIIKALEILKKSRDDIVEKDIVYLMRYVITCLTSKVILYMPIYGAAFGIPMLIFSSVMLTIKIITTCVKSYQYYKFKNELVEIKNSLQDMLKNKSIDDDRKERIQNAINDIERTRIIPEKY